MYKAVNDFTKASGYKLNNYYTNISEAYNDLREFTAKMVVSELIELLQADTDTKSALRYMETCIAKYKNMTVQESATFKNANKFVDQVVSHIVYASHDMNFDLNDAFYTVHNANMRKVFPDGTFHLREDGKVLKPPNFVDPVIIAKRNNDEGEERYYDYNASRNFVDRMVYEIYAGLQPKNNLLTTDIKNLEKRKLSDTEIRKEQVDAFIDIIYYTLNFAAKLDLEV